MDARKNALKKIVPDFYPQNWSFFLVSPKIRQSGQYLRSKHHQVLSLFRLFCSETQKCMEKKIMERSLNDDKAKEGVIYYDDRLALIDNI